MVNVASIAGYGWRANLERAKALADVAGFPDVPEVAGNYAVSDAEGYPVSKEALLLWTQRAAHQDPFKARGVRVNAVSPGPVATPILKEFRAVFGDPRVDGDISAVGRAGTASDIAPSDPVPLLGRRALPNGANLPVDGGLEAVSMRGRWGSERLCVLIRRCEGRPLHSGRPLDRLQRTRTVGTLNINAGSFRHGLP